MRKEMDMGGVEQVVGGTVCISESRMLIKFTELNCETYSLKCSYNQANILALTMYEQYKNASAEEYEIAVRDEFRNRGWI